MAFAVFTRTGNGRLVCGFRVKIPRPYMLMPIRAFVTICCSF